MRLAINGRIVEAQPGDTILCAARKLGVEIPTLCHREEFAPQTSCFLCVVRVEGASCLLPACATRAAEGMAVTTDSPEIFAARKTALELLLSDHAGCCVAHCEIACPADLDVPGFLAELEAGRLRESIAIIRRRLPFPAVLGRLCPAFCESPCWRKRVDEPLAIRALHRYVADADLASSDPYLPERKRPTGKRVAIVGAGPAGLSAAFFLLQEGHGCALFDAADRPGGLLRHIPADALEQEVVDAEIAVIQRLGLEFRSHWRLGVDGSLDQLRHEFDAVLLAFGASVGAPGDKRSVDLELAKSQGLEVAKKGIAADSATGATSLDGVFAAGEAVSGPNYMVRAVAAGRRAAISIHQTLSGQPVRGLPKPFYFWLKHIHENEAEVLYGNAEPTPRVHPGPEGLSLSEALRQAARCLQCGCEKAETCRLRRYADEYGANGNRFRGERRLLDPDGSHPELQYEPGKCILCGLCLKLAEQASEALGLCFAGRGFPTRVAVPFDGLLSQGIRKNALAYAEACPTGALSLKR